MGKAPGRPETFKNDDPDNVGGPGAYDSPVKFGQDVKPMTIG